jgi:tripartite-type tricarboxylate transporter receptor subunit TctC
MPSADGLSSIGQSRSRAGNRIDRECAWLERWRGHHQHWKGGAMESTYRFGIMLAAAALLGHASIAPASDAESYPARPVRFVVPFAAGGAVDILSRAVGEKLTGMWGQQVVIDNRPGAGGNIGAEQAARATADGYTVLLGDAAHANAVTLYRKLSYDFVKDFQPVTLAAITPLVVVVHPALDARDVAGLIKLAKRAKEPIVLGTGGNGSATHLGAELLMSTAGIQFVKVPYKSVPPALPDLISGQLALMFLPSPVALPHVRAGRIRAIAVTSAERSAAYPGVPAVAETLRGFEANTWYGMMVPTGTPKPIVARLHRDITRVLKMPDVSSRLTGLGSKLVAGTPAEFESHIRAEIVKWGKVIRAAGITVE